MRWLLDLGGGVWEEMILLTTNGSSLETFTPWGQNLEAGIIHNGKRKFIGSGQYERNNNPGGVALIR